MAQFYNQANYFDYQYQTTDAKRRRLMSNVPLSSRLVLDIGSGLGGRAPYWLEQGAERVWCIDINR
jgi:hypothetical protein